MQKSFYYRYYPVLMRVCIRYASCTEDAEQWVHDGFLRIFANLSDYRHTGSFEGWIRRIMVRLCIDNLRALKTRRFETENNTVYPEQELQPESAWVDNDFLQKANAQELIDMINTLPPRQRMVFNLVAFEDYSHKEVAALLEITENNSYALLHQARKQLKKHFEKITRKNVRI